ncbi:E3 ubiquitin-protein ligase bre1 [Vermiconidia calcicola]|uniref:E3 ubiquitin-protein ligase bre1 n=1 Tax=Vermiconidia calcicola TaxID=1690605 RepID=A0ACC3NHN2_9PEZI|nr:E3 ubiquitin-protein ligase bre1 [Vermiconidia calcicola]
MTTAQAHPPSALPPSFDKVKMEDRKRSLANDADEMAPSRKRLVKDENGQQMRMDVEKEKDVEDADSMKNYQKDAIMRQMKDYKRQRKDFEEQVTELQKKCQYHDDHLRTIDAWFAQLLDEVRVLATQMLPSPPPSASSTSGEEMYKSALLFNSNEMFSEHLQTRSDNIKSCISDLFGRLPSASPEVEDLRRQLNEVLAREKEHAVDLRKAIDEKGSLSDRLEQASYRYMTAEKKLDRAKSAQVLKLEKAAMMGGNGEASSPTTSKKSGTPKREHSEVNGELENGVATAEAENARKEAIAAAEKQKAQLEEIESENERLTNELSAARTKLASLSDDDYAETALFKTFRSQYDDTIKRVNDLEATNIQLREEAQKLHAERTSYRSAVDNEHRANNTDIEAQIARAENDLARIRNQRDEFQAELTIRRTAEDNRRISADQSKELAAARDSRISALESEVERLKLSLGESAPPEGDLDHFEVDTLKNKLRTMESQYALLSNELPSMEAAWKKTQVLASKKVEEIASWEETIARLGAEKAKADQKYFATMKARDMQTNELRVLKSQNARSSEIVSQLKDTEGKTRELVANLERQVAESMENLTKIELQHRVLEQKHKEASISSEGLKKQIDEMKTLVSAKDKEVLGTSKAKREAEVELEKCRVRLEETKAQFDALKKAKVAHSGGGEDDWRLRQRFDLESVAEVSELWAGVWE